MEQIPMTVEGRKKIEEELHYLKNEKRPPVASEVGRLRELGDLRENAGYHAAREELAWIDAKISQLETKLAMSYLVDPSELPKDQVVLGCTVKVRHLKSGDEEAFHLVGEGEAEPDENRILTVSPLGQALMLKKVGETASLQLPRRGEVKYEILEITPPE